MATQLEVTITRDNSILRWMMIASILGILGVSLYDYFKLGKPVYTQLAIVFALCPSIVNFSKYFDRHNALIVGTNIVLVGLAIAMLTLEIITR